MSRSRRGFTLIELLVVVGIIVLLVAIAMPVVGRAMELANQAKCQSNLRALSQAFFAFAKDHDNHLPGSRYEIMADQNPDHWDWLYGQYAIAADSWWDANATMTSAQVLATGPQYGTIWKYVGGTVPPPTTTQMSATNTPMYLPNPEVLSLYRCPSVPFLEAGTGIGSNGRFDYFYFNCWGGANLKDINTVSQLHFVVSPAHPNIPTNAANYIQSSTWWAGLGPIYSNYVENHPTPMIAQEDSQIWSNVAFHDWRDWSRQMAHVHNGGSYYAGVDGTVNFIVEPDTDPTQIWYEGCQLWFQNGPASGLPVCLSQDWGWYNTGVTNGTQWGYWSHK